LFFKQALYKMNLFSQKNIKKRGYGRNRSPLFIQYPMKNRCINELFLIIDLGKFIKFLFFYCYCMFLIQKVKHIAELIPLL